MLVLDQLFSPARLFSPAGCPATCPRKKPSQPKHMIELVRRISVFILNPIIQLMTVVAVAYFLWGIVRYFLSKKQGEDTNQYSRHIVWGLLGLTIMLGVFGLMRLIAVTVGADRYIEITDGGDIRVLEDNL